jgi:hypothetical protein
VKIYLSMAALVFSASANAGNYATCVIDRLPGTKNNAVFYANVRLCADKYPGGSHSVLPGSGRGWFAYDSGAECAAKKASDTPNELAARMIFAMCQRLYDPAPEPRDLFMEQPNR